MTLLRPLHGFWYNCFMNTALTSNLRTLVDDFLQYLIVEKSLSPLTIREYKHYLTRFICWMEDNSIPLSSTSINLELIRQFRIYLAYLLNKNGKPLSKNTQTYHVIALRSFLRYLTVKRDISTLNPDKIDLPKSNPRMINFLKQEQVTMLLNSPQISDIKGLRDKAILETFFSTGLRVSELVKLNRDQINTKTKEFGVRGKGNKIRVVFLSDTACEWITRYLEMRKDNFKPLFVRYGGRKTTDKSGESMRFSVRGIQKMVKKYSKKAGLPIDAHPHTLRHSFATDLLIAGADIRSVQEMLGHESIRTTQVYTHVTNKHLKEVYRKYHGRT